MPWAPVLTSLDTVQASQQGGRASQGLASRLGKWSPSCLPLCPPARGMLIVRDLAQGPCTALR